jgi:predicted nucleic acid-binding protein
MFNILKRVSKLKETKGAISLFVIVLMVFLLPFAIWVGIELPKNHELNQRVKDAVDSASSSGVTAIDNDGINPDTNVIPLDDKQARAIAIQIFASKMGLKVIGDYSNATLEAPEGSFIKEATVKVDVLDVEDGVTKVKANTLYFQTANGNKRVENSSVIVTATVTYEKVGFLGKDITVTHVGINQAKLKNDY